MAEKKGIDWSSLWKKDDWLGVWIGFLIIILILVGLTVKIPKFKWTTEGEFASFITKTSPAVEKLVQTAEEKGELSLKDAAQSLKSAMDTRDRKAIRRGSSVIEEVVARRGSSVKKR